MKSKILGVLKRILLLAWALVTFFQVVVLYVNMLVALGKDSTIPLSDGFVHFVGVWSFLGFVSLVALAFGCSMPHWLDRRMRPIDKFLGLIVLCYPFLTLIPFMFWEFGSILLEADPSKDEVDPIVSAVALVMMSPIWSLAVAAVIILWRRRQWVHQGGFD